MILLAINLKWILLSLVVYWIRYKLHDLAFIFIVFQIMILTCVFSLFPHCSCKYTSCSRQIGLQHALYYSAFMEDFCSCFFHLKYLWLCQPLPLPSISACQNSIRSFFIQLFNKYWSTVSRDLDTSKNIMAFIFSWGRQKINVCLLVKSAMKKNEIG